MINLPMSSTLDNFADSSDDENDATTGDYADFEENFSQVHNRLNSIDINLYAKTKQLQNRYDTVDEEEDNFRNSRKSSNFFLEGSMTLTEFQEISPQVNMSKSFKQINKQLVQKPTLFGSNDLHSLSSSSNDNFNTLVESEQNNEEEAKSRAKLIDKNDLKQIHAELIDIHKKIVVSVVGTF